MKDLNLNYEGFEEYLVERTDRSTISWTAEEAPGVQYVFRFENNYGASIIKHLGSYGYDKNLWELGVIRFGKYDEDEDDEYSLTYDTPITNDVEGYLTDEDVRNLLARIKEL